MKKPYIAPTIQIIINQPEQMIASSSIGLYSTTVNTEEEGAQLSNSRRGSWGDLWSEK